MIVFFICHVSYRCLLSLLFLEAKQTLGWSVCSRDRDFWGEIPKAWGGVGLVTPRGTKGPWEETLWRQMGFLISHLCCLLILEFFFLVSEFSRNCCNMRWLLHSFYFRRGEEQRGSEPPLLSTSKAALDHMDRERELISSSTQLPTHGSLLLSEMPELSKIPLWVDRHDAGPAANPFFPDWLLEFKFGVLRPLE